MVMICIACSLIDPRVVAAFGKIAVEMCVVVRPVGGFWWDGSTRIKDRVADRSLRVAWPPRRRCGTWTWQKWSGGNNG